jgi:hypothetical protein
MDTHTFFLTTIDLVGDLPHSNLRKKLWRLFGMATPVEEELDG